MRSSKPWTSTSWACQGLMPPGRQHGLTLQRSRSHLKMYLGLTGGNIQPGKKKGRQWAGILHGWSALQTNIWCHMHGICRGAAQDFPSHAFQKALEITHHWSWAVCLWWTVRLWRLEPSPWWNNEGAKRWQLQVGKGGGRPYVLVWFDLACTVWGCVCMAHLSFLRKPLQICSISPESGCCHPIVFIPSIGFFLLALLPKIHGIVQLLESIKKVLSSISGKKHNCNLLSHCKQELVHAI